MSWGPLTMELEDGQAWHRENWLSPRDGCAWAARDTDQGFG